MGAGPSSLHEAVRFGDVRAVRRLLRTGKHTVDVRQQGRTPLFRAVCDGNKDIIESLLDYRANPNAICRLRSPEHYEFEWTCMHEACRRDNKEVVQALIRRRGDVNIAAHHRMTPLHVAAWHGHRQIIEILIENGCDVDRLDRFQESAMVIPICHGDIYVVEQLLDAGCKLNTRSWGNTRKIRGKHESTFRDTLYGRQGPYTLLLLSVKYSWLNIGILLLQHGFNPNKYQLHDLLKSIKSSLGCVVDEGRYLLEAFLAAGYHFRENDEALLSALIEPEDHGYDEEVINWLKSQAQTPPSLLHICRTAIRSELRVAYAQISIIKPLRQLFIPKTLIQYLCLDEFTEYVQNSAVDEALNLKPDIDEQPLYFAMPRRRADIQRNIYVQFWLTTCCCTRK